MWSRVAQWKRARPITQRSEDRNLALLDIFSYMWFQCYFLSLCSLGRQWTTGINIDIIILLLYGNSVSNLDYYQTYTICDEFADFSSKGCTCNSFKGHCEYYANTWCFTIKQVVLYLYCFQSCIKKRLILK